MQIRKVVFHRRETASRVSFLSPKVLFASARRSFFFSTLPMAHRDVFADPYRIFAPRPSAADAKKRSKNQCFGVSDLDRVAGGPVKSTILFAKPPTASRFCRGCTRFSSAALVCFSQLPADSPGVCRLGRLCRVGNSEIRCLADS